MMLNVSLTTVFCTCIKYVTKIATAFFQILGRILFILSVQLPFTKVGPLPTKEETALDIFYSNLDLYRKDKLPETV